MIYIPPNINIAFSARAQSLHRVRVQSWVDRKETELRLSKSNSPCVVSGSSVLIDVFGDELKSMSPTERRQAKSAVNNTLNRHCKKKESLVQQQSKDEFQIQLTTAHSLDHFT